LNPSLPSPSCCAVSSSLPSKEEGRKRQSAEQSERDERGGAGGGRGRARRCAELRWKLDRASYYPLIATALNKSERTREEVTARKTERERERERERGGRRDGMRDGEVHPVIS